MAPDELNLYREWERDFRSYRFSHNWYCFETDFSRTIRMEDDEAGGTRGLFSAPTGKEAAHKAMQALWEVWKFRLERLAVMRSIWDPSTCLSYHVGLDCKDRLGVFVSRTLLL